MANPYRFKGRSHRLTREEVQEYHILLGWTDFSQPNTFREHQAIFTRGNPIKLLGRNRLQDIGGTFYSQKVDFDVPFGQNYPLTDLNSQGVLRRYSEGTLFPHVDFSQLALENLNGESEANIAGWFSAETPPLLSGSELDALGATAISRCAPTDPRVDGSTAIAELFKDGLPNLIGRSGNIGSEWLNLNFAVLPIFSDVKNFRESLARSDELLRQLARDSGRVIRRRYHFPVSQTTEKASLSGIVPTYVGHVVDSSLAQIGTVTTVTKSTIETWFSGAFTYNLPDLGLGRKLRELDFLYGVVPGVDTAWELLPWSWLVDYFTNVGDVLSNLNAFTLDGLIMPYGYIMSRQIVETEYTWEGLLNINDSFVSRKLSAVLRRTTLQRRPATPFGFGASLDLTSRQLANLAALGISLV